MGAERPISIIKLIAIARKRAKSTSSETIQKYLNPVVREGTIQYNTNLFRTSPQGFSGLITSS